MGGWMPASSLCQEGERVRQKFCRCLPGSVERDWSSGIFCRNGCSVDRDRLHGLYTSVLVAFLGGGGGIFLPKAGLETVEMESDPIVQFRQLGMACKVD